MLGSKRLLQSAEPPGCQSPGDQTKQSGSTMAFRPSTQPREFNIEGRGDMARFAIAAAALASAAFWVSNGCAAVTSGSSVPPASSALVTNCYKMAERIVP